MAAHQGILGGTGAFLSNPQRQISEMPPASSDNPNTGDFPFAGLDGTEAPGETPTNSSDANNTPSGGSGSPPHDGGATIGGDTGAVPTNAGVDTKPPHRGGIGEMLMSPIGIGLLVLMVLAVFYLAKK